jgi:hypothetical protein
MQPQQSTPGMSSCATMGIRPVRSSLGPRSTVQSYHASRAAAARPAPQPASSPSRFTPSSATTCSTPSMLACGPRERGCDPNARTCLGRRYRTPCAWQAAHC